MNREIKFRVWDGYKMLHDVGVDNKGQILQWESGVDVGPVCVSMWTATEPMPLMQYTGLKDKNGKEIYEGDLVRWDDCSDGKYWRVAEVIWHEAGTAYRIVENTLHPLSTKKGYIFKNQSFIYSDGRHLEIIGNIYENPELLPARPENNPATP